MEIKCDNNSNISNNNYSQKGIYIHIPFCYSKCNYCDFNSYDSKAFLMEPYFEALNKEIDAYSHKLSHISKIDSIFIGGGTPSYVDETYIENLLNTVYRTMDISAGAEVSIEANPGTLTANKLLKYKEAGINRLSLGLQAWQTELLTTLGRKHTCEKFVESFELARWAHFDNINVDLMFGIPGQTIKDWRQTLEEVVKLSPEHISCYSLKIEEGTPFYELYKKKIIDYIDDELEREMHYYAKKYLNDYGYNHYEISNYAKNDFKCKHNELYWKCGEYIGFGAGAHSYLANERYFNEYSPMEYIKKINLGVSTIVERNAIDRNERMNEFMMLGLRMLKGVNFNEFEALFGEDIRIIYHEVIKKLDEKGLVIVDDHCMKLSVKGLDFANLVFMEFV